MFLSILSEVYEGHQYINIKMGSRTILLIHMLTTIYLVDILSRWPIKIAAREN